MKLKSFKYLYCLLIILLYFTPLKSEEEIDIWKNNKEKKQILENNKEIINENNSQKLDLDSIKKIKLNQNIKIEGGSSIENINDSRVFGIYEPADNDFDLNMWSATKAEDIKASLKRIEKIKLSKTANQILENTLLSYSYAPVGMKEDEFTDLKINF
tara:strand:+ start:101 stop:571 length:471 start_codon:yes stop_codon:yes gene_type:complete